MIKLKQLKNPHCNYKGVIPKTDTVCNNPNIQTCVVVVCVGADIVFRTEIVNTSLWLLT